jgi:hypothetical protein
LTKIKNYTILYFHGLDSFLSGEKEIILQRFGTVISPLIDYKETGSINKVIDLYADKIIADVDIVIGSSMGGLVAYHVSQKYDVPCLLWVLVYCLVLRIIFFVEVALKIKPVGVNFYVGIALGVIIYFM